ncbi:MAG: PAS domain-containing sensor histidine kinase [Anaerolineales bacterium]|nr:PAS domain-containing sensor histidine kinase [Anaerolineales bacterium]
MSKYPAASARPGYSIDQRRGINQIKSTGIFFSSAFLLITLVLQLGHVFPFSLWPGILTGTLTLVWIQFIAYVFNRTKPTTILSYGAFLIQALFITATVYFVGGLHSPLPAYHIANVAAATLILGTVGGLTITVFSLVSLATIWLLESFGLLPIYAVWDLENFGLAIASVCYYAVPILGSVVTVTTILAELSTRERAVRTHQDQAEKQMKALEDAKAQAKLISSRLEAILCSTHEGMMLYDNDGKLVYSNPVVDKLLEKTSQRRKRDAMGTTWSGSLSKRLGQELRSARQNPHIVTHRVLALNNQPIRYIEVDSFPVSNKDDDIIGRLLILRDITDQKRLENVRDEWTRLLVHDLRSPLVSVIGNLELADDILHTDDDPKEANDCLKMARKSAQDLLNMVNSLLDISKLEAGKETLERMPVSLPHLAEGVQIDFSPMTLQAGLHIEINTPPNLPQVMGDRNKLQRVFVNLLDNAIKFTPDGGSITIQMVELVDKVRVSITDTGPGIPEDQHHAIFDRFSQLSGTAARRSGTGLGLTLCKLVVEAHGGRIWVETPPEGGSRFVFTLPTIIGFRNDDASGKG